jgi:hypothetical protein
MGLKMQNLMQISYPCKKLQKSEKVTEKFRFYSLITVYKFFWSIPFWGERFAFFFNGY